MSDSRGAHTAVAVSPVINVNPEISPAINIVINNFGLFHFGHTSSKRACILGIHYFKYFKVDQMHYFQGNLRDFG